MARGVLFNGSAWIALSSNSGNAPPSDFWALFAAVGETGAAGATGTTGTPGVTGATGSSSLSGPSGYLVKFTSATSGGDSVVYQSGTNIGIGTRTPGDALDVETGTTSNALTATQDQSSDMSAGLTGIASGTGGGIAVFGLANGLLSGTVFTGGSGGSFTSSNVGVSGTATTPTGSPLVAYNPSSGDLVQVNYFDGTTQYKILGPGTVSTVVDDPTRLDGSRHRIVLHAPEAPEIYFEDYGDGQLRNGFAHVELDPRLMANVQVDEKHPLRVFIRKTTTRRESS